MPALRVHAQCKSKNGRFHGTHPQGILAILGVAERAESMMTVTAITRADRGHLEAHICTFVLNNFLPLRAEAVDPKRY